MLVIKYLILLFNIAILPGLYADERSVSEAMRALDGINGFAADAEVTAIAPAFYALPPQPAADAVKALFEKQGIATWSAVLADYLSLSEIMFESLDPTTQKAVRSRYEKSEAVVRAFQEDVTRYVLAIHPGFSMLGITPLQKDWSGQGVRIVVFDAFEPALLEKQKARYPRATFDKGLQFGRPVELSHGNTVIDIILQLAPEATIIPVSSEAKYYADAMQAIAARTDVDILNMSRAFPEDPKTKTIDSRFLQALRQFTRHGLLVKALGNTGTDLEGTLNRRRVELGLGPVNTITSYDLKLIRDLYREPFEEFPLELFAMNLALFAYDIALTATVPGAFVPVQERTLAVPAEGIHSPSTGTFESGSSFAAPQITAWAALLMQKYGRASAVFADLTQHADTKGHKASEWGLGLPKAAGTR